MSEKDTDHHILYSFRRCPFAMRSRLALNSAGISYELREVKLKDKPQAMVDLSAKATVPVLKRGDGEILDESRDIMIWALEQNDPEGWLDPPEGDMEEMEDLMDMIEDEFKPHLDRYKYSTRYEGADPLFHRDRAEVYILKLERRLTDSGQPYLMGNRPSLADMATFPFIRQFASTDRQRFDTFPCPNLRDWLNSLVNADAFSSAMVKYDPWVPGDQPLWLPVLTSG